MRRRGRGPMAETMRETSPSPRGCSRLGARLEIWTPRRAVPLHPPSTPLAARKPAQVSRSSLRSGLNWVPSRVDAPPLGVTRAPVPRTLLSLRLRGGTGPQPPRGGAGEDEPVWRASLPRLSLAEKSADPRTGVSARRRLPSDVRPVRKQHEVHQGRAAVEDATALPA